MKKNRVVSLMIALVLVFSALFQAAPAKAATNTIVDVAASDPRFSTLVTALQAAGLDATLQGPGPFTVFAPTNDAFAKLPKGTVDALLADIPALTNVLTYHVAAGNLASGDVISASSVDTVQGSKAIIRKVGKNYFINNARIIITDIPADNGVIHVINRVILPPAKNIMETIREDSRFDTLEAAIDAAGLAGVLEGAGPFTLFAPTDAAFKKLPKGTVEALLADIPALTNVLTYHVLAGASFARDVNMLISADTVQGSPVIFRKTDGRLFVNRSMIQRADLLASNGVIHVMDRVLLPPTKDIVQTLSDDKRFETLVTAVDAAGLVGTLQGAGPFTVYAPTDAAFKKLPKGTLEALLADIPALTSVLTYHVSADEIFRGEIRMLDTLPTVNGAEIDVQIKRGRLMLNNARLVQSDILTTNGVIHVIDVVLLPPAP